MALVPRSAEGAEDVQPRPQAAPAPWLGQEPVRAAQRRWRSCRPSLSNVGGGCLAIHDWFFGQRRNYHLSRFGHIEIVTLTHSCFEVCFIGLGQQFW